MSIDAEGFAALVEHAVAIDVAAAVRDIDATRLALGHLAKCLAA